MNTKIRSGVALSPRTSKFGPLLFAGRLSEGMKNASELGFDVVELSIRSTDDLDTEVLNQQLSNMNLKVSALATGQACLFDCLCLCSENDTKREKAVEHLKALAQLAKTIACESLIIGGIRGVLPGLDKDRTKQFEKGIEAIRAIAKYTDTLGIQLLIEPINRYEMNWILTAREGLEILDRVNVNSVKLLLDTFHMNIEERDTLEAIRMTANRLGYVHIADNTRQAPGMGQIDFKSILNLLDRIDYTGSVVAEILPLPDDYIAMKRTADFWNEMR